MRSRFLGWSRSRLADECAEEGVTLIELLISVVILSIAVVGVVGAMGALTSSSALNRYQADVGSTVRSAAETVKNDGYAPCAGFTVGSPSPYALPTVGPGPHIIVPNDVNPPTVVQVTDLSGTSIYWPVQIPSKCPATDPGLQLVEVSDVAMSNGVTEDQWIAVSQVSRP